MSTFKAEDVKNSESLRALLESITNDPSIIDTLPEDELLRIENLVSPYGTVAESDSTSQYTCLSFTNLRQEYIKKLMITSLIGYLYRRSDEYGRAFRDTIENMDDMVAAEKTVISAQKKLSQVQNKIIDVIRKRNALNIVIDKATVVEDANRSKYHNEAKNMEKSEILAMREYASILVKDKDDLRLYNQELQKLERERDAIQGIGKRFIIRQFLDEQFRFNPDKHVRSSYSEQKTSDAGTTYVSKFVPPDDTFHNFQYYMDSNYEELRAVTDRLYKLKPDLDVGIIPYGSFATEEAADNFVERNKGSTIASIITLRNGQWGFLESFKANRDRIEAYRGTIVEDILAQVKEDTKLGAELTRDRAIRRRTENIKESKPDPKMIREYMSTMSHNDPGDNTVDADIAPEQQEKIWKAHQNDKKIYEDKLIELDDDAEEHAPHDTIRVNVLNFSSGGSNLNKSHFYSKAKAPAKGGESTSEQ
jgi:hypothetical protein